MIQSLCATCSHRKEIVSGKGSRSCSAKIRKQIAGFQSIRRSRSSPCHASAAQFDENMSAKKCRPERGQRLKATKNLSQAGQEPVTTFIVSEARWEIKQTFPSWLCVRLQGRRPKDE
jgi:hypothetical protein